MAKTSSIERNHKRGWQTGGRRIASEGGVAAAAFCIRAIR